MSLDLRAKFGDQVLGFDAQEPNQREGRTRLQCGRRDESSQDRKEPVVTALADHVVDQVPRRGGQDEAAQAVDEDQEEPDQDELPARPDDLPEGVTQAGLGQAAGAFGAWAYPTEDGGPAYGLVPRSEADFPSIASLALRLRSHSKAMENLPERSQAAEAFQVFVDLERQGSSPPIEEFVAGHDESVRPELRRMIEDYRGLRESLSESDFALRKDRVIGDFRLEREIGRGGMGVIWEAEQRSLSRPVALKILYPQFGFAGDGASRFRREAEACGRIRHEGITAIYAFGETEGLHYIAQELVPDGFTLAGRLAELRERGELPPDYYVETAELFVALAGALQAAHDHGVVHRDVKPSNVLLDARGRPKLADFGLAMIQDQGGLSRTGELTGTPFYMSPEQAASKRMGIDHRTDVFSLGATLFEALTLRRPFEGDTSQQVLSQILVEEPPDPRSIRSRCPADLSVICLKALEKSRERRYPTMASFQADLVRFVRREPILARPPGRVRKLALWASRNRTRSVAGAIAIVAFFAIAALAVGLQRKTRDLIHKTVEAQTIATRERNRADEVLRLSAIEKLDDLLAGADELWPPHPQNIEGFERWITEANELVAGLDDHRATREELRRRALPRTDEQRERDRRAHPDYRELQRVRSEIAALRHRLYGTELDSTQVVDAVFPEGAKELADAAWELVGADRRVFGQEVLGLEFAWRAVEAAERPEVRAYAHLTLAHAMLSLGRDPEALQEVGEAVRLAQAHRFGSYAYQEAWFGETVDRHAAEDSEVRLKSLEGKAAELELRMRESKRWEFADDDASSRWWDKQLTKLIEGLESLSEADGLLSPDGVSVDRGWSMPRRLDFARGMEADYGPGGEYAARWQAQLPSIRGGVPRPRAGRPRRPRAARCRSAFATVGVLGRSDRQRARRVNGVLEYGPDSGMVFVLLPGGTFQMGAQSHAPELPRHDPRAWLEQGPVHEVELDPFFISKYEVNQAQWKRCVGTTPSLYGELEPIAPEWVPGGATRPRMHPVETVDWFECSRWTRRLGFALPTEAQWEYAARGGTDSIWWMGSELEAAGGRINSADRAVARNGIDWPSTEESFDDGYAVHAPVDSLEPNGFGLHHILGNVWEWCRDAYHHEYYSWSPRVNPCNEMAGEWARVNRGGSFRDPLHFAKSAHRASDAPGNAASYVGVRPVRSVR